METTFKPGHSFARQALAEPVHKQILVVASLGWFVFATAWAVGGSRP